jgi:hypothetical protein
MSRQRGQINQFNENLFERSQAGNIANILNIGKCFVDLKKGQHKKITRFKIKLKGRQIVSFFLIQIESGLKV